MVVIRCSTMGNYIRCYNIIMFSVWGHTINVYISGILDFLINGVRLDRFLRWKLAGSKGWEMAAFVGISVSQVVLCVYNMCSVGGQA